MLHSYVLLMSSADIETPSVKITLNDVCNYIFLQFLYKPLNVTRVLHEASEFALLTDSSAVVYIRVNI